MFRTDGSQLRKLGKALRTAQPDVYRQVRREVREQALKVAEEAKQNASFSTRIPDTIRVSVAGVNTAVIRAGGDNAPHAAAFEHAGSEGTFRHPVFARDGGERDVRTRGAVARRASGKSTGAGDWVWVDQKAHPFLHPAVLSRLDEIVAALGGAVVSAVDDVIDKGVL